MRAGEIARLECHVGGDPPLTVTWAHRGQTIHHSARYVIIVEIISEYTILFSEQ